MDIDMDVDTNIDSMDIDVDTGLRKEYTGLAISELSKSVP